MEKIKEVEAPPFRGDEPIFISLKFSHGERDWVGVGGAGGVRPQVQAGKWKGTQVTHQWGGRLLRVG